MNRLDVSPLSVSLNGVDNVGKTTQVRWLHHAFPAAELVGKIDDWEPRWQQVAATDFARWWFVDSTTEEHVNLTFSGHTNRRAASGPLAFEDRGAPMLLAACAATAALKEGLEPFAALERVKAIMAAGPQAASRREFHILLRRYERPEHEAVAALEREAQQPSRWYRTYQEHLAAVISAQVECGDFDHVETVADQPILEIHRRLRELLAGHGMLTTPMSEDTVDQLWVLGGLSESGKSTVGELFQAEHGIARLKIGYLMENAAARAGIANPYTWDEIEQAEQLSCEVLRFAAANKARQISVESAHRFEATAHLKRLWGDRATIVYVDADEAVRVRRSNETLEQVRARDAVKCARGADRIGDIADVRIDNNGPLSGLKAALERRVRAGSGPVLAEVWEPETNVAWLRSVTEHLVDTAVALVLATGSTGAAGWRNGWSDLDLLVVRDALPLAWLRERVATIPVPHGAKTGVSAFTTGDLASCRVPPRVLHALRHAAEGEGVLYQRPGFLLPLVSAADDDRASRGELGLVLMTTRRLLADEGSGVRDLYKHLVLLAKITLRADGVHADDPDTVLARLLQHHPDSGCTPPDLDELIADAGGPELRERVVKSLDNLLSYLDQIDTTVRNPT